MNCSKQSYWFHNRIPNWNWVMFWRNQWDTGYGSLLEHCSRQTLRFLRQQLIRNVSLSFPPKLMIVVFTRALSALLHFLHLYNRALVLNNGIETDNQYQPSLERSKGVFRIRFNSPMSWQEQSSALRWIHQSMSNAIETWDPIERLS